MNKKNTGRKVIKTFTVIVAVILLLAITAVLAVRFVILPKISERLESSDRGELAAIIDQNNNFGAFAMIAKLFADKGMIEFVTTIDNESAASVIDLMEEMDAENTIEPSPAPATPWQVDEHRHIETPSPAPQEVVKPTPPPEIANEATSAYERISKVASDKEMSDGLAIISKLNMGYIASLISGGLTPSEKMELKSYVYSKLTKAEISRSLSLYNKYKKYL